MKPVYTAASSDIRPSALQAGKCIQCCLEGCSASLVEMCLGSSTISMAVCIVQVLAGGQL